MTPCSRAEDQIQVTGEQWHADLAHDTLDHGGHIERPEGRGSSPAS